MPRKVAFLALALVLLWGLAALAADGGPDQGRQYLGKQPAKASLVYHGNVRSHKFHRPGCRYYHCKNCTAIFTSREQAISAGYVPCKVCKP